MTQLSTDSADPPGSVGQADRSRTYGPVEGHGPAGPIERLMSTLIRKLAWSRLSDPKIAVTLSGPACCWGYSSARQHRTRRRWQSGCRC